MTIGFTSYFWWAWPLLTDVVLLGAGLLFVIRLYLVERQFEEGLIGFEREYLKRTVNRDFRALPEDEWFLAHGFEYQVATPSQCRRLARLRTIVRLAVVTMISLAALFGVGALFAATSTGSLTVSAIVLSRCVIRFPSLSDKVESTCTDGVSVTKDVIEQPENKAAVPSGSTSESSGNGTANQQMTTVTFTY